MKFNYSKILITTVLTAILTIGVSYVYATGSTGGTAAPGPSARYIQELPVHTAIGLQIKKAGIWSKTRIGAPIGFFKKSIFLPGTNSKLRIGSASGAVNLNSALFGDNSSEPLVIDLQNRSDLQNGTRFINGDQCSVATRLVNDKAAAFEFRTGANPGNIIARQVQLTGGDPDVGEVLVSDANGNARWAKATVSGGQVVFDNDSTSPVPAGQCIAPEPIVDVCTNIDGDQSTVPTGMVKDTAGNTPGVCTVPPTLCSDPNASNQGQPVQCVCNNGYVMVSGQCTVLETFDWSVGQFSSCNAPSSASWQNYSQNNVRSGNNIKCSDWLPKTLPGGTQSRSVTCVNTTTNQVVPNDQCNQATKPISEQSCAYTTSYRTVKEKTLQRRTSPTSYTKSVQSTEILNNICASPFVTGQAGYYPSLSSRCDSVAINNSSGSGRSFASTCTTPVAPNVGNFYPVDTSVTSDVFYRSSNPSYEYYKYILQVLKP